MVTVSNLKSIAPIRPARLRSELRPSDFMRPYAAGIYTREH